MSDDELLFVIDRNPSSISITKNNDCIKVNPTCLLELDDEIKIEILEGNNSSDSDDIGRITRKNRKKKIIHSQKKNNSIPVVTATNKCDLGDWEKHTKGFGSKILAKYNYTKGVGLGPVGKGIVTPVMAAPRTNVKAGIGLETKAGESTIVKLQVNTQKRCYRERKISASDEECVTPPKQKSPEPTIAQQREAQLQFVKKSLLEGGNLSYINHGLHKQSSTVDRNDFNFELVDYSDDSEDENKKILLSEKVTENDEEVDGFLVKFEGRLENCDHTNVHLFMPALEDAVQTFSSSSRAAKVVGEKLLKIAVSRWHPVNNMFDVIEMFTDCRELLTSDVYETIFSTTWMGSVLQFMATEWGNSSLDNEIIDLIVGWRPEIPDACLEKLFVAVVDKLVARIAQWNPLVDQVAHNESISLWMPVLDHRIDPIQNQLRQKLSAPIIHWNVQDESLIDVLDKYRCVFSQTQMDEIFTSMVLPRLQNFLKNILDRPTESIAPVFLWSRLMPAEHIEQLLDQWFLMPMSSRIDEQLASADNDDSYKSIATWYQNWTRQIPTCHRDSPIIKVKLNAMLQAMMRAKTGKSPLQPLLDCNKITQLKSVMGEADWTGTNLRDTIEQRAHQIGACFYPKVNKFHNQLQIYRFGTAELIIDRQVIYTRRTNQDEWSPVLFTELIGMNSGAYIIDGVRSMDI